MRRAVSCGRVGLPVDAGAEVSAAAVQVDADGVVRQLRVAVADRLSDEGVLGGRGDEAFGGVPRAPAHPGDVHPDHRRGLDQVGVAGRRVDGLVELVDKREVLGHDRGRCGARERLLGRREPLDVGVEEGRRALAASHAMGGEASRLRLQAGPHLEEGVDVVAGDLGHDDAAPPRGDDEAVGREPGQPLAQRGTRDAEARSLLHLTEGQPGRKGPVEDLGVQLPVCAVARLP